MIIWPKDTNNKQSTEPQFPLQTSSLSQNVSQSDNQYLSTIISDETFSVEKFVHTDLNVRSGPGENYRSLFVVDQESLVKVSDTSKEKAWVKIKYNDNEHIGWVNGTYLRDFRIDSVTIENFDDKGAKITNSEKKLYASQMKYLGFSFNVIALNDYDENVKICAKITTPEKVFDINWSVEIKDEKGWNCWVGKAIPSDYYEKHPGKWKIQIYYKNPKNEWTDKCYLFSKEFQLY